MVTHAKNSQQRQLDDILDDIRRIVRVLRTSSLEAERRLGISGAQLFVLQVLRDGPAPSVNDLAERTHTHQSSVSVVVKRLADRGLVKRTPSPEDGRRVSIELTDEGRALVTDAPEPMQLRIISALESMPEDDRAELRRLLGDLTQLMGVAKERPEMFFGG